MPLIIVNWYPGRSLEQKRELAKAITEVVARIGKTTPEATQIIFQEVAKEDWATAGVLASERK